MRRWLGTLPVYPAVLAAAFVITRFLQSIEPFQVLPRALVVFVLVALAIQVVATLLTRNLAIGAFGSAATVMVLADPTAGLLVLGAGAIPLTSAYVARSPRLRPADWARLTTILNFVAVIVLVLNIGPLAIRGSGASSAAAPASAAADPDAPDIYLIMLDGYPRADTLRTKFEFDNGPFLQSMEDLGFEVAEQAHSNYNLTLLTLASMFNMRPAQEIVPDPPSPPKDAQLLIRSINEAIGMAKLRELGYTIVTVPSGIAGFTLYSADQVLDTGQINNFEITIARAGLIPLILPDLQNSWVHTQLRNRITTSLDLLVELAGTPSARPRLVFAHVMSPHPPLVFAADGSPREGWGCYPKGCDPWGDIYGREIRASITGQIAHLNVLVHEAVAGILHHTTRQTVIIVFSDHGRRSDLGDKVEMIHSLFLSHTPDHPGLFPSDTSPINTLPRLLNAYNGLDLPLASEDSYVLDPLMVPATGYFDLLPWEP